MRRRGRGRPRKKEERKFEDASGGRGREDPRTHALPRVFGVVFPWAGRRMPRPQRKGPHGVLSTLPDQGTAAGDEGTAAAGTTASPEGGAVLRTPLGWEPKAHWCSRAGQETARRRRTDRSPVKLSFESQPPLLADVSKPAFPCARDYIPLLFLFMFCYCCHSLNRYAVYKT